jgi:hypothetical protein
MEVCSVDYTNFVTLLLDTDIAEMLLAVPGLNVNAAMVSCVWGAAPACCYSPPLRLLRA